MNHALHSSEVLVIGGGPAGASIARLLALRGHHVTVVSRPVDDRRGIAESLPPSTRKVMAAVGVLDAVERGGACRNVGNVVWWGSDDERFEDFQVPAEAAGLQVWRPDFDRLLMGEAKRAGVEWLTGNVTAVDAGEESVRIRVTTADGRTVTHRAAFVVDASGRSAVIGRAHRRPATGPRVHAWIGSWTCADDAAGAGGARTFVETTDEGWIWSVPAGPGRRSVAVMVDPEHTRFRSTGPLEQRYHGELARSRHIRARLAEARFERVWGCDASMYRSTPLGGARYLVVGDAGSFIDPLSSFGVKKALTSAWMGAAVVHTCLIDPGVGPAARQLFESREREAWVSSARRSAEYARQAIGAHDTPFWQVRSVLDADLPDPAAPSPVTGDGIERAFEQLRQKSAVARRPDTPVWFEWQPAFRTDRVVLEPAICGGSLRQPVRLVDSVDLTRLVALVPGSRQVGELFAGYCTQEAPVPLPNFLRALSVLVAGRVLEPVDG